MRATNIGVPMKRLRAAQCQDDSEHTQFVRKEGKCDCGSVLVAPCQFRENLFSYSHIHKHEKGCPAAKPDPGAPPAAVKHIRFAYLASDWELAGNDAEAVYSTAPRGQYWDGIPVGCPARPGQLRVHKVQDPSMRDMEWMEAYDAVFVYCK